MKVRNASLFALLGAVACASAGPYGYDPDYVPLDPEESAAEGSRAYDPVMAGRDPAEWKSVKVSAYGVVTSRRDGPGGTADVTLSLRTLEPRNLCESADSESCRVTVSEREHGIIHALLALTPEDAIGEKSLNAGSLVRAVGTLGDAAASDGAPSLRASYYRHWPRNHFVTTAARSYMRR